MLDIYESHERLRNQLFNAPFMLRPHIQNGSEIP